ncbi:MAG: MFS transporter [Pirellulales bacterium]|nr:MFS transporter [Pirellulales bacterium]
MLKLTTANRIVNDDRLNRIIRKDLMAGHAEGAAFGGMVGLGETYLPAFVLAVGLGEITAGLVASVPLLAGGLMQMISPLAVRRLASYKRWVLICAFVQAASFVPMVLAAARGRVSTTAILLVAAIYWASGLATGPAWNTWMGALVPRTVRARFFAHRTLASQLAVLGGFVAGGCLLQWADAHDTVLIAFLILFIAAGGCRLLSLCLLSFQQEPALLRKNMKRIPAREIVMRMHGTGVYRLLLYLVVVQGSVQLAGPFFTPYMFIKLQLSYGEYVVLIAMFFITKIFMLPVWGSFAHRLGAMRLLWLGGIGIAPLPAMWIFSDNFGWLLFTQALSGVSWGAYELGFFLLFFDSIPEEERTGVLTFYNLANTVAWVLGSAVGGLLLYSLGTQPFAYLLLFGISSVGRCLALLVLKGVPTAVAATACAIGVRTVGVRPMDTSIDVPILPSLPDPANVLTEEYPHMPKRHDDCQAIICRSLENGQMGPQIILTEHGWESAQHLPWQRVQIPEAMPIHGPTNLLSISDTSVLPQQQPPRAGAATINAKT